MLETQELVQLGNPVPDSLLICPDGPPSVYPYEFESLHTQDIALQIISNSCLDWATPEKTPVFISQSPLDRSAPPAARGID